MKKRKLKDLNIVDERLTKKRKLNENPNQLYPEKKKFNPIARHTKTEKDTIYCEYRKIPIMLSFNENDHNLLIYKEFMNNYNYFLKNKKDLITKNWGSWFSVWLENNKPKCVKGRSYSYVSSRSPVSALISFGCNQDFVYEKKIELYHTIFSSQNENLTEKNDYI